MREGGEGVEARRGRLLRWGAVVVWAALIFLQSSLPDPPGSSSLDWLHADKVAHAVTYGVLAALLAWAGGPFALAWLLAVLYGVTDELHQVWTPGRDPDALDLLADAVGAALGAAAVAFLTGRRRRRKLQ